MRSTLSRSHIAGLALLATTAISPLQAKELTCDPTPDVTGNQWIAFWPCDGDVCEEQGTSSIFPGSKRAPLSSPLFVPDRIVGLDEVLPPRRRQITLTPAPTSQQKSGSGLATYVMNQYDAPSPAILTCEDTGSGFICEAFPQSDDGITYSWSTTGGVSQPYPNVPSSPFKTLSCNGSSASGSVTVTVYSPYGVTATAYEGLYCGW